MAEARRFDHIVVAVEDLDAAARRYEALGFTLTPRAAHEARMGTSNRLAQFAERNFIELLEVDRPGGIEEHAFDAVPPRFSFGAHNRDFLRRGGGLSMLVLASEDAKRDHADLLERGLEPYAPFSFERRARLPDGAEVTVGFSLVFATSPSLPGLGFFLCQQHAPQYFWKPEYQWHANGARGLAAVTIATEDPASAADFLARLTNREGEAVEGGFRLDGADQELLVLTPERIQAAMPGCGLAPASGPRFAGVALRSDAREPGVVPASEACGLFLEWRRG